jgi:aerobic carbon-monoxide dehydrogenase medium subunit
VPANKFYKSLYTTALAPDEILTEVRIPVPPPHSGGAYEKLKRKTGDFAAAAVAVQLTLDRKGAVERAGIGLTSVAPTPVEAVDAAKKIVGTVLNEKSIDEAARLAANAGSPSADRRGSVEYKREMTRVLATRALRRALQRAGGK